MKPVTNTILAPLQMLIGAKSNAGRIVGTKPCPHKCPTCATIGTWLIVQRVAGDHSIFCYTNLDGEVRDKIKKYMMKLE
jgi:hypothetical protein